MVPFSGVTKSFVDKMEKRRQSPDYKLKRIEEAASLWFDGLIDDRRMAEIAAGLTNEEAQK